MSETENALAVLLVEDNPGDAKLVQHHLRQGSFPGVPERQAITHVESLEAALEAVDSSFDVILLDLGLPECAGVETLDSFLPEASDVPVIVLTGLDDKETAVEAIQRGAQDYLPKDDLSTGMLMRAIRYAIERQLLARKLQNALDHVKQLQGLLPICSACKNIRGDDGYWNSIESYIADHSDAQFTHSICPECARKLYPDLFGEEDED